MKSIEEKREYMRLYVKKRREESPEFLEKCRANARTSRARRVEKAREEAALWKKNNKQRVSEYNKKYHSDNAPTIAVRSSIGRKKNKDAHYKKHKEWVDKNRQHCREYTREYSKNRTKIDPTFHLKTNVRGRICAALNGRSKAARSNELLGCSYEFFREYIERQFVNGMNWGNRSEWHIDHKIPLAAFDLSKPEQQKVAFHYSNQRPLWKLENLKKGAKLDWEESRV